MTGGYTSRKIKFADLQVGDIVSDNQYKHLSVVLIREEASVPDATGTPNIVHHKFENATVTTPLESPDPIMIWAHTKVNGG